MLTRREAIGPLGSRSAGPLLGVTGRSPAAAGGWWPGGLAAEPDPGPPLAPGAPMSPERMALIDAFRKNAEGIDEPFESRSHQSDWTMPSRLFRPEGSGGPLPLVVFLHGSGGTSTGHTGPSVSKSNSMCLFWY